MKEFTLKYGCNPHQQPARIYAPQGELPLTILNGRPGYINFLDALNAWQLTSEIKAACGLPAAASFKHVSPAGAACGLELSETLRRMYFVAPEAEISPLAAAYIRARGADRMSSFGDWIALSDVCDVPTAQIIAHEVSDGIIAPGYEEEALAILKNKRKGNYNIVAIDEEYQPPEMETKEVFGICFEQMRNHLLIDRYLLKNVVTEKKDIPAEAERDLLISLITLKYTQSNSVCYAKDGQTIGVGAGQQSRIHCTRLAGDKADLWHLRQHPYVLDLPFREDLPKPVRDNAIDVYLSRNPEDVLGVNVWADFFTERPKALLESEKAEFLSQFRDVSLGSDAFFPFDDNIARAARSGVGYIAQPGGSIRDEDVIEACNKRGMVMVFTGSRLFHH
ncbi:MAG: phosphoribosylaminoimidazolecarboxamide formyltransferase [Firmicutes bacterium]|nr:phosphoribosylaminoimidazolecarboxamide formyltransferase [Bacillota bacterium]